MLQDQRTELDQKLSALKEERDAIGADEDKIKTEKIEIDQEIEKCEGVIRESKSRAHHWRKQVWNMQHRSDSHSASSWFYC